MMATSAALYSSIWLDASLLLLCGVIYVYFVVPERDQSCVLEVDC